MDYDKFKAVYIKEHFEVPVSQQEVQKGLFEHLALANRHATAFKLDNARIDQLYECLIYVQDLVEEAEQLKRQFKKELQAYESKLS